MNKKEKQRNMFKTYARNMLASFAFVYMCLYCGRLNLSLSIPTIISQTSWNTKDLGILSSILLIGYSFGQLINGRISEIIGSRKMIITGVLSSILLNFIISFQNSLPIMALLFILNGYVQSMVFAPGVNQISKWWPAEKRGLTSGIAVGCAAFAQVVAWLAVFFSFKIAPNMGWRAAFRLPLVIMLLSIIIYYFFAKENPSSVGLKEYSNKDTKTDDREKKLYNEVKEKGKLYPYIFMFKQWKFLVWLLISFVTYICRYGLITWIPQYYVQVFGVNITDGIIGTVFLPLGMAIGSITLPTITDKLCPKNRMPAVIIASLFAAISVAFFRSIEPGIAASILLFMVGFFVYSITGIGMTYAADLGGRVFSGTASGILDCAANAGGALQAVIFGFMLNKAGNWNNVFNFIIIGCLTIFVLSLIVNYGMKKERD